MAGGLYGKRLQRRRKIRWLDDIKELTGMSMHQVLCGLHKIVLNGMRQFIMSQQIG